MDLDLMAFRAQRWFAGIARDKRLHFGAGVVACAVLMFFTGSAAWGIVASFVAGAAKEVHDHLRPVGHTVDHRDVVATTLGGVLLALAIDAARWLL